MIQRRESGADRDIHSSHCKEFAGTGSAIGELAIIIHKIKTGENVALLYTKSIGWVGHLCSSLGRNHSQLESFELQGLYDSQQRSREAEYSLKHTKILDMKRAL